MLDLSLVSRSLDVGATWELYPYLASDHFASVVSLPVPSLVAPPRPPRWNLRTANWAAFSTAVADSLAGTNRPQDLDAAETRLVNALATAADKAIPHLHPVTVTHRDRW